MCTGCLDSKGMQLRLADDAKRPIPGLLGARIYGMVGRHRRSVGTNARYKASSLARRESEPPRW